MVTKLRKYSKSKFTKIVMATIAFGFMLSIISISVDSWRVDEYYGGTGNIIERYDAIYNTNYYNPYKNTIKYLENELYDFSAIEEIKKDNFETSVHEVLNVDIQKYIDLGVRYFLLKNSKDVIGTDGITEKTVDYWNYLDGEINNRTISDYVLNNIIDNSEISKEEFYTIDLIIFYEKDIAKMMEEHYVDVGRTLYENSIKILIYLLLFFFICGYFIIVGGTNSFDKNIRMYKIDKMYYEISIMLILTLIIMCIYFTEDILNYYDYGNNIYYAMNISALLITASCIYISTNIGKRLRLHIFLDGFFVIKYCKLLYLKIKDVLMKLIGLNSKKNIKILWISMLAIYVIMVVTLFNDGALLVLYFLSLLLICISLILALNLIKVTEIVNKINNRESFELKESFDTKFLQPCYEDLDKLSNDMHKIYAEGEKAARVKTELITNVSHDLRTPLTSIIGFVDLLGKKADNYDEETKEYIKILSEKSNRMSTMVKDLFDLAKTVSGDIYLEKDRLSVKKLIEQILNELDDLIDEERIYTTFDETLFIEGDGNKMYRVVQNLVENAVKYSLAGTNIYIDTYEKEEKVYIEFKNISSYKMDFTSEDIVERFYRGDASRTDDGNGLGLSIAKTYTNINNGEFNVKIDGDLFKVILIFNKC